jgi:hypothetical protein
VVDCNRKPLMPCHPARARQLLRDGKAAVLRRYPFTIILKHVVEEVSVSTLRLKIDPGSKVTGLAIVDDTNGAVVFAAELTHRGYLVSRRLTKRRLLRRARRYRKTRYRKQRSANRRKPRGWLPPSLQSRIDNIATWIKRLCPYAPIAAITVELVDFDQKTLQGKHAAAVFSTRQALLALVRQTGLRVEVGTGFQTAANRKRYNLPKQHWIDALCIGSRPPDVLQVLGTSVLKIKATGHGRRQRCITNKYGFPIRHAARKKSYLGFQTGDIVRAKIPCGKFARIHTGRIVIRFKPMFYLDGFNVHPKYLELLHKNDGYSYSSEWYPG